MADETAVVEPQETTEVDTDQGVSVADALETEDVAELKRQLKVSEARNAKLRKENASHRTRNRDERQEIAQAVGLDADAKVDDIATQVKVLNDTVYNLQLNNLLGEVCEATDVNRDLAVPYLRSRGQLTDIDLSDPQAAATSLVEVFQSAAEAQPALRRAASKQENWSQPDAKETKAVSDRDAIAKLERLAADAENTGNYSAYLEAQRELAPSLMKGGAFRNMS